MGQESLESDLPTSLNLRAMDDSNNSGSLKFKQAYRRLKDPRSFAPCLHSIPCICSHHRAWNVSSVTSVPENKIRCNKQNGTEKKKRTTRTSLMVSNEAITGNEWKTSLFQASRQYRALGLRTRTNTSTRFNIKLLRVFSKRRHPGSLHFPFFFHQKS